MIEFMIKINKLKIAFPIIIILLNFLLSTVSCSCTFPPAIQTIPYEELVSKTENIVLARVIRAKFMGDRHVNYSLEPIEEIKGTTEKTFEIDGSSLVYPNEASDFSNHENKNFWYDGGRSFNNTMCNILPSFAVGQKYIIFINTWEHHHVKSFELILSSHDLWYKKVKELVKHGSKVGIN